MDDLLPEKRREHAQDIRFVLKDAGCRPKGCCENTGCESIHEGDDIPFQVARCSRALPTGCYFYARASANITGSLCRPDLPNRSIWSFPDGVAFDMKNLNGWAVPSFTLWRFHNIAARDCDKISLGTSSDVSNIHKRAIRPCPWTSLDEESEMLIESNQAPMSAFSSATIRIGNETQNDIDDLLREKRNRLNKSGRSGGSGGSGSGGGGGGGGGGDQSGGGGGETTGGGDDVSGVVTIRLKSHNQSDCKFTLDDYFRFPLLEVPLQLLVTSTSAISEYVSKAVDTTIKESVGPDLEIEIPPPPTTPPAATTSRDHFDVGRGWDSEDQIGSLIEKYGKTEVVKLYLKYLTTHHLGRGGGDDYPTIHHHFDDDNHFDDYSPSGVVAGVRRRGRLLDANSTLFTTPYWPPVNWAWSGSGGGGVGGSGRVFPSERRRLSPSARTVAEAAVARAAVVYQQVAGAAAQRPIARATRVFNGARPGSAPGSSLMILIIFFILKLARSDHF